VLERTGHRGLAGGGDGPVHARGPLDAGADAVELLLEVADDLRHHPQLAGKVAALLRAQAARFRRDELEGVASNRLWQCARKSHTTT
jgi:hypothetical protein